MNSQIIIIYQTSHTGNTKKLAEIVAKILECECVDIKTQQPETLKDYKIVGFASGIYFGSFGKKISKYVKQLDVLPPEAFLFSSHGGSSTKAQKKFNKLLNSKNCQVVDTFSCFGRDTAFTVFKKHGGFHKDRPNSEDLKQVEQ
jgi:flavodoxin